MNPSPLISRQGQRVAAFAALVALYAAFAVIVAWAGVRNSWAEYDQKVHHLPQINYLIAHPWSLFDYPATAPATPGFHLLVATVARFFGVETVTPNSWLRLVPFLLGLATLAVLWRVFLRLSGDPWRSTLLCLPLLPARYFILAGIYFDTESAAYLGYALLLLGYLEWPERGVTIGLVAAATVFARQIFLGVSGTQLFALSPKLLRPSTRFEALRALVPALLLPLAVFGAYVVVWHGPVPPEYLENEPRAFLNPAPVVQAIALLGLFALPYVALCHRPLRELGTRRVGWALAGGFSLGLLVWSIAPTTHDAAAGRLGSIVWLLARVSPAIGQHALLVLPCLILGFAVLGVAAAHALARRYLPIEFVMLVLYSATLSGQFFAFQRYTEVLTLIALSTLAARFDRMSRPGAVVFAAMFLAMLPMTLRLTQ
jgi:hypothetical protein